VHVGNQTTLLLRYRQPVALGGAGLADRPADSTLGIPQPIMKMINALPPAGWGQEFFEL
jgi:hypothetical protein